MAPFEHAVRDTIPAQFDGRHRGARTLHFGLDLRETFSLCSNRSLSRCARVCARTHAHTHLWATHVGVNKETMKVYARWRPLTASVERAINTLMRSSVTAQFHQLLRTKNEEQTREGDKKIHAERDEKKPYGSQDGPKWWKTREPEAARFHRGLSDAALAGMSGSPWQPSNLSDDVRRRRAGRTDGGKTGRRDKATIALMRRPNSAGRSSRDTVRDLLTRSGLKQRRVDDAGSASFPRPEKKRGSGRAGSLARSAIARWKLKRTASVYILLNK